MNWQKFQPLKKCIISTIIQLQKLILHKKVNLEHFMVIKHIKKKTMLHLSFYCLIEKLFIIYVSEFMVITRDSKDLNLLF